ncbi:hypothetical protein XELAEV_18029155mg [Xenopus laevis]|uniref:Secreted protein n=1 Tax=Xenopus laevis TaxID=8355 RepID=A0A974CRM6_XENLA|nr:hypothetical protein XELAEV_18029155mg [Xenopus laevis]
MSTEATWFSSIPTVLGALLFSSIQGSAHPTIIPCIVGQTFTLDSLASQWRQSLSKHTIHYMLPFCKLVNLP